MADNRYRDESGGWREERGREPSNSIFGDDDRDRWSRGSGEEDRGFLERAGEGIRSWFAGDEGGRGGTRYPGPSHYGSQHGYGGFQGDYSGGGGQGGFGGQGDYGGGRQSFSGGRYGSGEHDHYLSWRERQIAELDRDYEEYCRERQQRFQSDFDSWRQSRQGGSGAGTTASTGSSGSSGTTGGSTQTGAIMGGSDDTAGSAARNETESAGGSRSRGRS
jgi:hypothetical protein